MGIFYYPYFLLVFWVRDVVFGSVILSKNIIVYWLNLVSVPLLSKTFFKPLKNEYRDGLVLFSILMGIIVKTILLISIFLVTLILIIILLLSVIFIALAPLFIMLMLLI